MADGLECGARWQATLRMAIPEHFVVLPGDLGRGVAMHEIGARRMGLGYRGGVMPALPVQSDSYRMELRMGDLPPLSAAHRPGAGSQV